jgi:maltose alpha-D-glucosyltransferase/alpha-amylase
MQWSDNRNAGFSTGDPGDLVNPVVDDGEFAHSEVNVADQFDDPNSLLSRIKRIVEARKLCTEVSKGRFGIVDVDPKDVWVHRLDYGKTVLMTAHNAAEQPREVTVDFDAPADATTRIVGSDDYEIEDGRCTFHLDGYDYVWIRGDTSGQRVPLGQP